MARTKSSQKRDDILSASKILFLKHGFNDVSMDNIRLEANVSKNTLYGHFKDKNDLFCAAIKDHWQNEKTPKISLQDDEDVALTIKKFAKALLKYLYAKKTRALFRILIAESERFPGLAQSIVVDNKPPILLSFAQFLQDAYGFTAKKAERAAIYFFGLLKEDAFWHVLAGFRKPYSATEIDTHVDAVVALFLVMLRDF